MKQTLKEIAGCAGIGLAEAEEEGEVVENVCPWIVTIDAREYKIKYKLSKKGNSCFSCNGKDATCQFYVEDRA